MICFDLIEARCLRRSLLDTLITFSDTDSDQLLIEIVVADGENGST